MRSSLRRRLAALAVITITALGLGASPASAQRPPMPPMPPPPIPRVSSIEDPCRFDASGHGVRYVVVEPGVSLEVLDWGGNGPPLVLLTGLGDNAHVFDAFALRFTDRFRVVGITRRGFGRSSQPTHGYDLDTRARDDIAVLDALKIRDAVFAGHSVAGTEMSKLAAAYPDRVKALVYLDALDIGADGWSALPQPPGASTELEDDLESIERYADVSARLNGYRAPLAALCHSVRRDRSGRLTTAVTPPEIQRKIIEGLQPAAYDRIRAPALGIFNAMSPRYRLPYYGELPAPERAKFDQVMPPLAEWSARAIRRFKSGIEGARVIEVPDANHYVFIVEEALVVKEMRKFLLGE